MWFKILLYFFLFRKRKAYLLVYLVENKICYFTTFFPMESNKCLVLIASKQKNILVVCNENLNVRMYTVARFI